MQRDLDRLACAIDRQPEKSPEDEETGASARFLSSHSAQKSWAGTVVLRKELPRARIRKRYCK